MLKAPERVDRIAQHIAQHFQENVAPQGFKGFVVAIDREGCALYHQALARYLPEEMIQVVYTANHKDDDLLRQHHIDDDEEKRIRRAFRDPDKEPQILIVTQKLLTGFDAPVLYAMYLDKPMKDHTLLQAIARVNRPYPGKESGLIVDYIGIFEDLQRALSFEDEPITKGLLDIEVLRARFVELLADVQDQLAPIDLAATPGRTARIIDHFFDEDRRALFTRTYKDLQAAYETLAPDPFLRDYLDEYAFVVDVYQVVYSHYNPEAERRRLEYDLLRKTDALIRERVSVYSLTELPVYPVHRDIATVVEADDVSERVKVTNLHRSLTLYIQEHQAEQPFLISIGDQVEAVIQKLRDRQISTQSAMEQLIDLNEAAATAEEEQAERDVAPGEFALYWVLKGQGFGEPDEIARAAQAVMDRFPAWPYDSKQESSVRLKLYGLLKPHVDAGDRASVLKSTVDALLRMSKVVQE